MINFFPHFIRHHRFKRRAGEFNRQIQFAAVTDVYDALTSQRPYRVALSDDAACEYLLQRASINYDPTVVAAFLHLLEIFPNFRLPQLVCALPKINLPG